MHRYTPKTKLIFNGMDGGGGGGGGSGGLGGH